MEGVEGVFQDSVQLPPHPALCHHLQTVQLRSNHRASLPHQPVQSVGIPCVHVTPPTYHSKKENTGYYRLVKHLQQPIAYIKRPEPPQEEQFALSLPVEGFGVISPVKSTVHMYSQELVGVHHLHLLPSDGDGSWGPRAPPEVHHQLLGLSNVELEVIVITPPYEVLHQGFLTWPLVMIRVDVAMSPGAKDMLWMCSSG